MALDNEKEIKKETAEETADEATVEEVSEEAAEAEVSAEKPTEKEAKKSKKDKARELEAENLKLKEQLATLGKTNSELEDKYKRVLAEYDNYRKRTAKEKEGIYSDAYGDALSEILPIMDTLEMAAGYNGDKVAEGVKMTLTQFKSTLEKLGVEEIASEVGGEFNAELHNAVMSADNPDVPSGSIAMVLRKGYKKGDKVYRYAMVAVAN